MRVSHTPRKKVKKPFYKRKSYQKLMGKTVNGALDYASRVEGPIGTVARGLLSIKNLINVETHFKDANGGAPFESNPSAAGTLIQLFNGISQGDDHQNRNGISILNKSLSLRMLISRDFTPTTNSDAAVRLVIIMDKKPELGTPTWTTVYGSSVPYTAYIDKENVGDRFVIMKEIDTFVSDAYPKRNIKIHMNIPQTHTRYDGTGATYGDIQSGALFVMALTDNTTDPPVHSYTTRFRYYDN